MARVATPAGVDGAHSNFLDLVAVFDSVYAVSWRERKKRLCYNGVTNSKQLALTLYFLHALAANLASPVS